MSTFDVYSQNYTLRLDQPRQTIWGLGFEIQSDSINSNNRGYPETNTSVPHDLVPSERRRLNEEMLKGFRYIRLAMGNYLRGLDAEQKHIIGRWDTQMDELRELFEGCGAEGFGVEYWSPAPYWKSNGQYRGGTIKSTDPDFVEAFSDALVQDIAYLEDHGLKVIHWSLQNEPTVGHGLYSTCTYTHEQYYAVFKAVAPKIKSGFPHVFIHADSMDGQHGRGGELIRNDPDILDLVDGWSWHRIGYDSDTQIDEDFQQDSMGKPVFNTEFEYLHFPANDWRFVNNTQSVMNWMVFQNSPTWYWIHALKPLRNEEASGYALGFWREWDNDDFSRFGHIEKGHWDYNPQNWHSLAGFLKYMPWDSVRYHVEENVVEKDNRIMAWKTPDDKLVIALTNRRPNNAFRFEIELGQDVTFSGYRYTPTQFDHTLGNSTGSNLTTEVPPFSIEFWIEE